MVDPKQVELELYSGLPYLLGPIIHESEKAIKLLKWAVAQMEKRYGLLKEKRVKNIDEYNAKIM
jgi:S-DNA-T family DNA segregation ATPase FtsK/SpoIIIE